MLERLRWHQLMFPFSRKIPDPHPNFYCITYDSLGLFTPAFCSRDIFRIARDSLGKVAVISKAMLATFLKKALVKN